MSLSYHHDYFGGAAGKRFATLKKSYEAKSGVRLPDFPPDWGSGKPSRLAKKPRMAARKDGHLLKPGMAARKDEHLSKRRNGSPERRDDRRERPPHWGRLECRAHGDNCMISLERKMVRLHPAPQRRSEAMLGAAMTIMGTTF